MKQVNLWTILFIIGMLLFLLSWPADGSTTYDLVVDPHYWMEDADYTILVVFHDTCMPLKVEPAAVEWLGDRRWAMDIIVTMPEPDAPCGVGTWTTELTLSFTEPGVYGIWLFVQDKNGVTPDPWTAEDYDTLRILPGNVKVWLPLFHS